MSKYLSISSLQKNEKCESDADQYGWLVSYADLITLLFVLFAVLLSISSVSKTKLEFLNKEMNQSATSTLSQLKSELEEEIKKQNLSSQVSTELTQDGLKILFSEDILFKSGEAALSIEGANVLKQFCHSLAEVQQNFYLAVEGHTDSKPIHTAKFSSNWALSAARSVNVLHFLGLNGVSEKRMMVRAYASTRPLEGLSEEDAKNRRVSLLVF